mmetsp:Transcript_28012/g.54875  ORF Transcript_28012/g.54875 Transcript_28012/m.54875 type:complete len:588 (+) Transcript_28012:180-1943(+)
MALDFDFKFYRQTSLHRPNHYVSTDPAGILHNGHFNKGTCFTMEERDRLGLRGLLPSRVEDLDRQVRRCLKQLRSHDSMISKYNFLSLLRVRSDTLFYKLVTENLRECLPIIYTPTVGQACREFAHQYRYAEGMYFNRADMGKMREMLDNWRPNLIEGGEVAIIVVTDGSRILGLGDLGVCGMGIPIGKLSLYVAAAGFHPAATLPVCIDAGTNNEDFLQDEFYLGCRHKRLGDDEYFPLMDEFLNAVKEKWPRALLQFEDFSTPHCFELLEKYRKKMLCFNDDIQGTGAVISAGILSALKMVGKNPREHRFVFLGAGSAGIGVADMICALLERRHGMTNEEAKKLFYLVDSKGLVTTHRGDKLAPYKVPYARTDVTERLTDLTEVCKFVKPTGLIGLSGVGKSFSFELLEYMGEINERPIVFPLSNPTSNSECSADDAFRATKGRCVFASGSPFPDVVYGEKTFRPSQGNNMYIFPGLGFGAWLAAAQEVSDGMICAAAETLSDLVTPVHMSRGELYPGLEKIRDISAHIAASVMKTAWAEGHALAHKPDCDLLAHVKDMMYTPEYLDWEQTGGRIRLGSDGVTPL